MKRHPIKEKALKVLLYLAKGVAMGKRTVVLDDLEYGLEMATRAADNPMRCMCLNCIMQKGPCHYDHEYQQEVATTGDLHGLWAERE